MLDRYWFGAVDRISPEAPVPVVRVNPSKEQERLGGAANVAWNVKALGSHPSLLTTIGDDEHGRRSRPARQGGIETLFKRDPRLTTTVKLRVIGRSQQLLRVDFEEEPDHEVLDAMRSRYERR
jgi:rfaE bifunctional protein kinase chain/domain